MIQRLTNVATHYGLDAHAETVTTEDFTTVLRVSMPATLITTSLTIFRSFISELAYIFSFVAGKLAFVCFF